MVFIVVVSGIVLGAVGTVEVAIGETEVANAVIGIRVDTLVFCSEEADSVDCAISLSVS